MGRQQCPALGTALGGAVLRACSMDLPSAFTQQVEPQAGNWGIAMKASDCAATMAAP